MRASTASVGSISMLFEGIVLSEGHCLADSSLVVGNVGRGQMHS